MSLVHVYHDPNAYYGSVETLAELIGCDANDIEMIPDERLLWRSPLIVLDGGEPTEASE